MKNLIKGISKLKYLKIVKMTVGCTLAMFIAYLFDIEFYASAGILTIITLHDTTKETLKKSRDRVLSFIMSLVIAYILFKTFGFNIPTYGLFILVFVLLSNLLRIPDHIVVNSVLTTHFLSFEAIGLKEISNEIYLLIIGVGIGIVLNLFMPSMTKRIKNDQKNIETKMKELLVEFGNRIMGKSESSSSLLEELETFVDEGISRARANAENRLFEDVNYYINYMKMRKKQFKILKSISDDIEYLDKVYSQSEVLGKFMFEISESFHEKNNAIGLLKRLEEVKRFYKNDQLPKERKEFENRAFLYQILVSIEEFLIVKRDFVLNLSKNDIKRFWSS